VSNTSAMVSEAHGGEVMKKSQVFWSGINSSKKVTLSKLQMKSLLITFFNIYDTVNFELIPQGQSTKLIMWKY